MELMHVVQLILLTFIYHIFGSEHFDISLLGHTYSIVNQVWNNNKYLFRIWFFPFWNIYGVCSTYMNKKENNFQFIRGMNLTLFYFIQLNF
jgi:hypothetical protein